MKGEREMSCMRCKANLFPLSCKNHLIDKPACDFPVFINPSVTQEWPPAADVLAVSYVYVYEFYLLICL